MERIDLLLPLFSVLTMKGCVPEVQASQRPVIRNHSPYCESTGPITRTGFVASRIRALQTLQSQAQEPVLSHPPTIHCPPRWLQTYEPHSEPKSSLATGPTVNPPSHSESSKNSTFRDNVSSIESHDELSKVSGPQKHSDVAPQSHWRNRQSLSHFPGPGELWRDNTAIVGGYGKGINTISHIGVSSKSTHGLTRTSKNRIPASHSVHATNENLLDEKCRGGSSISLSENDILSPQAIPVTLTSPAIGCNIPTAQQDFPGSQSKSIAQKLDAMIDHNLGESGALDDANQERMCVSETTSPNVSLQGMRKAHRSQSQGLESHSTIDLKENELQFTSDFDAQNKGLDSIENSNSIPDDVGFRPLEYHEPQKTNLFRTRHIDTSATDVGGDRLDARYFSSDDNPPFDRKRKSPTWTLRDFAQSDQSKDERIKLRTFKSSRNLNYPNAKSVDEGACRVLSNERTESMPKTVRPRPADDQSYQSPATTSIATSSSESNKHTTPTSQSPRMRSTSFFGNWRWWKPIIVDKQPKSQDLRTTRSIGGTVSAATGDSSQQVSVDHQIRKLDNGRKAHEFDDCGHESTNVGRCCPKAASSLLHEHRQPTQDGVTMISDDPHILSAIPVMTFLDQVDEELLAQQKQTTDSAYAGENMLSGTGGNPREQNDLLDSRDQPSASLLMTQQTKMNPPVCEIATFGQGPVEIAPIVLRNQRSSKEADSANALSRGDVKSPLPDASATVQNISVQHHGSSSALQDASNAIPTVTVASDPDIEDCGILESLPSKASKSSKVPPTPSYHSICPSVNSLRGNATNPTTESLQRRSAGRDRGITRVQVIISLFEADDVVVEARLQKRGRSDKSEAVEG